LGEHAVVYGKPALAVPLSTLRAYAEVTPLPQNSGLKITARDLNNQVLSVNSSSSDLDQPLVTAALLLLHDLGSTPPDANIILHSDIPVASGMGSGAAVTTALFRAMTDLLGKPLSNERLNDLVYEVEKTYHGTPSGVDNTVVVFEKPIYFVRSESIERLTISKPLTLLIADTGIGASTKLAVADVRTLYNTNQASVTSVLDAIERLVIAGRKAIELGDSIALGTIMNENHRRLQELTVSSTLLDQLVAAAQNAGALGAKLSGGGRGGNMIALVSEETVSPVKSSLIEAGAVRVHQTTIS
jgi:mevalonate kinase